MVRSNRAQVLPAGPTANEAAPPIRFPVPRSPEDRARRAARELDLNELRRLQERALRVLSKGVVHRMNNLLAVQSSHAQLLSLRPRTGQPIDGRHLLDSIDRGNQAMGAVGALLALPGCGERRFEVEDASEALRGPAHEARALCLGSFLRMLEDLMLCEHHGQRFPLEVQAALQVYGRLTRGPLLLVLSVLIDHLCEAVPPDVPGRISLRVEPGEAGPLLELGFERGDQQLPFPIEPGELPAGFARYLRALGVGLHRLGGRPAYELQLP